MYTAMHGNVGSAATLVEHGAAVNAADQFHATALVYAVNYGHDDIVLFLLDHGAAVNGVVDINGDTPLLLAINALGVPPLHWHPELRWLDYLWKRMLGWPEDYVELERRKRIVGMLLDRGADVNAFNARGHTALGLVALSGNAPFLRELLARGADPNVPDTLFASATALILAAKNGNRLMVDALLERGADPRAQDSFGRTALSYARERRDEVIAMRLADAGATE